MGKNIFKCFYISALFLFLEEKFENVLLKLNLDDFDVNLYEYLERNLKGFEFIYLFFWK